jgi:ABC-type branched-subunit amino acid transport system ATPase component
MPIIMRTENLCRHFGGVIANNSINVEFRTNQLKSIIGPNGAGKTTLINIITGLLPSTSGLVFYQDRDITNSPPHDLFKLGICRTFQITSIFPGLTTFENVRIAKQSQRGGSFRLFSTKESLKEVNDETWVILKRLHLVEMANVLSENLSHGDQRVLEIALAMAGNAKILFLDEPTAGMSSGEAEHISSLIKGLTDSMSVVLIEHDMDIVMSISDEIIVMNQGKIIAEGSPQEIQLNEKVKEAYLGTK